MPAPEQAWRPDRRRLGRALERLRAAYGRPLPRPHGRPVEELILTVLSQNTNDRNRDVAWRRLSSLVGPLEAVRDAPVEVIEEAIRPGGLAPTKAVRIRQILDALDGDDLMWLEHAPLEEARAHLCALPGVGRKTAACVLLFAFGRPDIPVDTHVYRVTTRLGLLRPRATVDQAHDDMLRLAAAGDAWEAHVALIRHGRRTCLARSPRCDACPLLSLCPYGRSLLARPSPRQA